MFSAQPDTTVQEACTCVCVTLGVSVFLRGYLGALLLQADQLSLVEVCSTGVDFGQLSVGVHQLFHRLLWHTSPDGGVDALHGLQHCTYRKLTVMGTFKKN